MLSPDARVYVAGHRGMVGSAVWRALESAGFTDLIGWSSAEVDLTDRDSAMDAVLSARPDVVVVAAAKVGGIMANATYPVEFLTDNLRIQTNLFEAAHAADVDRLLFLGSSCIYPRMAPQPIPESALLTGPLESTNDAYAIAKIAGIIGVQSYRREYGRRWISAMPTNLYGPGDTFDLETAHVLPALIRRFHEASLAGAPSVTLWGTGSPRREFLHVDDLAAACLRLLDVYDEDEHINVGVGDDVTIAELAALVADVVGYSGEVEWDAAKPDGTPRKLLDVSRISALGWEPQIGLAEGIGSTYETYRTA
ncbi:MAG: GDP-L-fucose synthase [Candidatus Nanopelagicales bacterium]|jgi:GDP-L-fucose synthase|nr:GDP-L-fucose synthase [Candidatus Nanopelagicales bacterium]MDP4714480.1 GDP-L-fucose synthase [Candidatus Nanopelagicales bacterium]MDP4907663.1 GDP-L-fucose synthase [Candidatus Nanopelagicales bacterium]MDP4975992.1 GDP-L-fucose synthase [Candidatus Nanopelagicales bacterium]MDP5094798.1 GDP-L-fucose synthase [Candidatus Nanopelagicales bacterium]